MAIATINPATGERLKSFEPLPETTPRQVQGCGARQYGSCRPDTFDCRWAKYLERGKQYGARRPASEPSPSQSASCMIGSEKVRPEVSVQDKPSVA